MTGLPLDGAAMPQLTTLSNGAVVIADPMKHAGSAALSVTFKAGALDETVDQQGLAHLLEHMAFKGTTARTSKQLAEEIEGVGGTLNAATGYETTSYEARVLGPDLPLAFELLADILQAPTLAEEDLDKERDVVLQEIAEAADTPDDVVFELLQSAAFGDHPLGRPILGTKKTVSAHTTAGLRSFIADHYAPPSMVIAVAGAASADGILKLAEQHFGGFGMSAGPDSSDRTTPPDGKNSATGKRAIGRYVGGRRFDKRDSEQTHIAVAAEGYGIAHENLPALQIFAEAFGGGWSSRLFQAVREERGLSYSVYAFTDVYEDTGLIGAYAGVDADKAPAAAALIRETAEQMARDVTQEEIDRARAMIRAGLVMEMEDAEDRADAWVSDFLSYGRLISLEEEWSYFEAVGLADVRRAAERFLAAPLSLSLVGQSDPEAVGKAIGFHP